MDAKKTITVVLLMCLCVIIGWFCRRCYDDHAADNNDATVTVQQAQRDNQSAREDIGNAAVKIDDAQSALIGGQADIDRAAGRLNELQKRSDSDAAVIDECQSIINVCRINIEEAKRIFADIDKENRINE